MAKFHCIHCGQRIDAPDELAGTDANCPACGGAITVPALSATPPPLPVRQPPSANSGSHNPTWPETFQAAGKEFTRMVEKAALETDGFKQVHADVFGVLVYSSVNFIKLVVAQKPEEQLQYHVVIENIKKERVITLLMGLCKGFLETSIVKMPSLKAQLNPLLHLFDFELCLTHTDQTPTSYVFKEFNQSEETQIWSTFLLTFPFLRSIFNCFVLEKSISVTQLNFVSFNFWVNNSRPFIVP